MFARQNNYHTFPHLFITWQGGTRELIVPTRRQNRGMYAQLAELCAKPRNLSSERVSVPAVDFGAGLHRDPTSLRTWGLGAWSPAWGGGREGAG